MGSWKSAKNSQRNWFIVLLVINTFGILEIIYLFYFSNKKSNKNQKILT
jgi:methionyl-tRNA synthetase